MVRKLIDAWLERRHIFVPDAEVSAAERIRLARLYGGFSLAHATLNPDAVSSFGGAGGYIAYSQKMGYAFALGDPLAAPTDRPGLIRRFIERFGEPWFVQISEPVAATLAQENYWITSLGFDTVLPLDSYSFAGKEKEGIRHASNWLARRGYVIEERTWSDDTAAMLAAISQEWRGSRIVKGREMGFINRAFRAEADPGERVFVLFDAAGRAVAFIIFDPLYAGGKLIGYVTALKRRLAEAGGYAELGLMRRAVETFQHEGLREVRLGLSPLAPAAPPAFRDSALLRTLFRHLYRSRVINGRIF